MEIPLSAPLLPGRSPRPSTVRQSGEDRTRPLHIGWFGQPLLAATALLGHPVEMRPVAQSRVAAWMGVCAGFPSQPLSLFEPLPSGGEALSGSRGGLRLDRVLDDPKSEGGPGESGPESS